MRLHTIKILLNAIKPESKAEGISKLAALDSGDGLVVGCAKHSGNLYRFSIVGFLDVLCILIVCL